MPFPYILTSHITSQNFYFSLHIRDHHEIKYGNF